MSNSAESPLPYAHKHHCMLVCVHMCMCLFKCVRQCPCSCACGHHADRCALCEYVNAQVCDYASGVSVHSDKHKNVVATSVEWQMRWMLQKLHSIMMGCTCKNSDRTQQWKTG